MSTLHELFTSRMVSQRVICETAFIMGPTSKSCHKVSHFYYKKIQRDYLIQSSDFYKNYYLKMGTSARTTQRPPYNS